MERSKIFVDSSVIISAAISSTGGSFHILNSPQIINLYELCINEFVLEESTRVLKTKFKSNIDFISNFYLILNTSGVKILSNPSRKSLAILKGIINTEDAPILASALESCAYLLTLDNDFFNSKTIDYAERNNLFIMKPGQFITSWI